MRLVALLLIALPAFPAEIVSAFAHIPGGGFRIPIPDTQINWKEAAIRIVSKDVEAPVARLQDLWMNKDPQGNTDFSFQVPVPQQIKDRQYYVISQYGLTRLRVRNTVGGIRYSFDPDGTRPEIKKVIFAGNAIFDPIPEDEYVEGAFALIADAPVATPDAVDIPEGGFTIASGEVTLTLSGTKRSLKLKSPYTSKTEAASVVTIGTDNYVFVQWTPERNGCQWVFSLLKLTATAMEEAGSTVYGCEQF